MYNGDVTLTADALESFEGAITVSGGLTITGSLVTTQGMVPNNYDRLTLHSGSGITFTDITTGNAMPLTLHSGSSITLADISTGNVMPLTLRSSSGIATGNIMPLTLNSETGDLFTSSGTITLSPETLAAIERADTTIGNIMPLTLDLDTGDLILPSGSPVTLSPEALAAIAQGIETEIEEDPAASSNNSSTGAIVGGVGGGVVLLTSIVYWLWPSDKAPLAQFQAFNADAYLPARQWIGMEHALTENLKFAVGSFWLSDGTVDTIIPSMDNTGVDARLSLASAGIGELSFSAAAFNYKDADSQYNDDGTRTDLFLDNFQVSDESLKFGYAFGLQWRASF